MADYGLSVALTFDAVQAIASAQGASQAFQGIKAAAGQAATDVRGASGQVAQAAEAVRRTGEDGAMSMMHMRSALMGVRMAASGLEELRRSAEGLAGAMSGVESLSMSVAMLGRAFGSARVSAAGMSVAVGVELVDSLAGWLTGYTNAKEQLEETNRALAEQKELLRNVNWSGWADQVAKLGIDPTKKVFSEDEFKRIQGAGIQIADRGLEWLGRNDRGEYLRVIAQEARQTQEAAARMAELRSARTQEVAAAESELRHRLAMIRAGDDEQAQLRVLAQRYDELEQARQKAAEAVSKAAKPDELREALRQLSDLEQQMRGIKIEQAQIDARARRPEEAAASLRIATDMFARIGANVGFSDASRGADDAKRTARNTEELVTLTRQLLERQDGAVWRN